MNKISKSIISVTLILFTVFLVVGCQNTTPNTPQTPSVPSTPVETAAPNTSNVTTTPAAPSVDNKSENPTTVLQSLTTKELHIEAYNCGFSITHQIQINKGDTVKIFLTSAQGTHDFEMPDFNITIGPVNPGEEKTAEFAAKYAGTYDYSSNIPCGTGQIIIRGRLEVLP